MWYRDQRNEILESLNANRFRTFLTAFGVFWGIFILLLLLAAGNGVGNGVQRAFDGLATNSLFMWPRPTSVSYQGLNKGRHYDFKLKDIQILQKSVPGLKIISPRNRLGGFGGDSNVKRKLKNGAYDVYGDYPDIVSQQPIIVLEGRFINQMDLIHKRKVAVIGTAVVDELYAPQEPVIGSFIQIDAVNFQVIGIQDKKENTGQNPEQAKKEIYIPFTTFGSTFNTGDKVDFMAITAADGHSITELKASIFRVIKKQHQLAPSDDQAIGDFDLYERFNQINSLNHTLRIVAYFVGLLVLFSGVIGIGNIMMIVVRERTMEIGIRRAVGASPWNIRLQVLSESLFLTLIAGMVGIVLATGIIWAANRLLENVTNPNIMIAAPGVSLESMAIVFVLLIGSGLLAGYIPAQKAVKIKPIDALREE